MFFARYVPDLSEALYAHFGVRISAHQLRAVCVGEDWDSFLVFAQAVNACAKHDPFWYAMKEELLWRAVLAQVPGLRYNAVEGIVYAETSQGQVSFHVFDDLAETCHVMLGHEHVIWAESFSQKQAPMVLARLVRG